MNPLEQSLTEQLLDEHSKAQTRRIAAWIGHSPERFEALMRVFLRGEHRLTQRAAWVLREVGQKAPELLPEWMPQLVAAIARPDAHDAVKRNVLGIFGDLDFPPALDGELADLCFRFVDTPSEAAAIRAFAMTVLARICRREPALNDEFRLVLETHFEHATAAFRSRARKILKELANAGN